MIDFVNIVFWLVLGPVLLACVQKLLLFEKKLLDFGIKKKNYLFLSSQLTNVVLLLPPPPHHLLISLSTDTKRDWR